MGNVTDISEVHGASIFSVEVCRVVVLKRMGRREDRVGIGASSGPVGTVDEENFTGGPF